MEITKSPSRALVVSAALTLTTTLAATLLSGCSATADQSGLAASDSLGAEPSNASSTAPWVLFQQDAGARQEVAVIRVDGTEPAAPLHDLGDGHQTNPDWSPDGRRIVFAMSDGERDDLWIADADGHGARKLVDCSGGCRWLDDPAWSPPSVDRHEPPPTFTPSANFLRGPLSVGGGTMLLAVGVGRPESEDAACQA